MISTNFVQVKMVSRSEGDLCFFLNRTICFRLARYIAHFEATLFTYVEVHS